MSTGDRRPSWDLFCRVVDNFGDIGIAWRLARQLASDSTRSVRLVVDDVAAFARIEARVDPQIATQTIAGIGVRSWLSVDANVEAANVVVEVLGCGLPPNYIDAMAAGPSPVWIDFEHLSAEPWVADFHGLPSPHPRLALVKHFFYPGFGPRTGGLLLEPGLAARRDAFLRRASTPAFWRRFGIAPPSADEMRVLVFAYPSAPLPALLAAMATDPQRRWSVVIPRTTPTAAIDRGSLSVRTIPFVDQDTFDELLWTSDLAFVRGEDSFVRAQAAGRPFVWQIYAQAEAAHRPKLAAFEDRYEADLPPIAAAANRALWAAWNGDDRGLTAAVWRGWLDALPDLRAHADAWGRRLAGETPLVDRLVAFVDEIETAHRRPCVC